MLLIGTDAGIPMKFHSMATWNELDVWVTRLGVDPIAVRGDVRRYINLLQRVDLVMKRGVRYK